MTNPPAGLAKLATGTIIEGTVVGRDARGLTLVQTNHGMLTLRHPQGFPNGSRLLLELQTAGTQQRVIVLSVKRPGSAGAGDPAMATRAAGRPALPTMSAPAAQETPRQGALAREWPGLREALNASLRPDATGLAQALQAAIPRIGPDLSGLMLLFLAALRSGDVRAWLGRQSESQLAAMGRRDLFARLAEDFKQLRHLAFDEPVDKWRVFLIPIHDGAGLQQIQFYLRRQRARPGGEEDERPLARFVFQFELSRLGPMQLDGLAGDGRLDLIVRSRKALPSEVKIEATRIFHAASKAGALSGDIAFQKVDYFPVAPIEEAIRGAGDGVVA